jgi:signal transduction histidine kinase
MLERLKFSATTSGWVALTVLVVFGFWAWVEVAFTVRGEGLNILHALRGVSAGLASAAVVAHLILKRQRRRERERDALARERDLLRSLFEDELNAMRAGVLLLDDKGMILKANRTAETIHGRALQGVAFSAATVCGKSEGCAACPVTDSILHHRDATATRPCVSPTAEVFLPTVRPVTLPEGGSGVLVIEQVTTEQVRLRSQLIHQEKMATFGLLAAGIAHDLGNPINAVAMHLQLLQMEDDMPAEAKPSLDMISEEINRMQRVLRELVDLARRRRDDAAAPVDLARLIKDAITLLRHDRRMREVEVSLELHAETPEVEAVEDHLMQVILNLIINALDAMPIGGTLTVEAAAHPDKQGYARLRVRDNGEGMGKDTLAHCMEPLFTTKAPGKGTGLGLSIVKDIITAGGGDVEIQSALGRGTTITLTLPGAELGQASEVKPSPTQRAEETQHAAARRHAEATPPAPACALL